MEQTIERRWHEIWPEQCEAAETIRLRHGVESAFDYVVGEKLLNFAEVAAEHREFAQALPQFVSRVRGMFTPEEMATHLARDRTPAARAGRGRRGRRGMSIAGDDEAAAERARQFDLVKELLTAPALGTS